MINFRIFCELITKMVLETIDFTMVFRGYRRNEQPEILGITTLIGASNESVGACRNEQPEILGITTLNPKSTHGR